jgi:hypothetical protein
MNTFDSVSALLDNLAKLLPITSPQWAFAASVLTCVATLAHAWGIYRGAKAMVSPSPMKLAETGIRLEPPSLPPEK